MFSVPREKPRSGNSLFYAAGRLSEIGPVVAATVVNTPKPYEVKKRRAIF